ncbi:hypothetical protein ACEQ8H_006461 [Pleosporales sp. CAS-2024a]
MTSTTPPEVAAKAEALIPQFKLTRLLSADQAGRRISLLGTISSQPALLIAERAAFSTSADTLSSFSTSLRNIRNLGANDIYAWFLVDSKPRPSSPSSPEGKHGGDQEADFKINLIYPCTHKHIQKYDAQKLRVVTESPLTYASYVRPYMAAQRHKGTLNWVYNILDGRTEQDDVMYREDNPETGFLLLPDLNWDRKTLGSLHLLGIVQRRDLWSVRDLKKKHVAWVRYMRAKMLDATCALYPVEADELKLYLHCKALGLDNTVSQLEAMAGGDEAGMHDVSLTYHLGERSELWEKVYLPLKQGRQVNVHDF